MQTHTTGQQAAGSWQQAGGSECERGVTLIDTVVGTALMLVVFLGIAGAFILAVDVVTNDKARAGAIALANERMEYVRSLTYAQSGTVGGVPAGSILQSETVSMNGVTYTRRTVIEYGDDPKDGVGAADQNGIPEDFKAVKVDVAWQSRAGTRDINLVSRMEPPNGMEITCSPCGTLTVSAVNAASQLLPGASVSIVNSGVNPPVNINTFTNANGIAQVIGAPVGSGYQITVSKAGYSTSQTYSASAQNTNPNPGNLTVANAQTTTGTFAIDVLSSKTINTWTQILPATSTDAFSNSTNVASSTNVTIGGGQASMSGDSFSASLRSTAIEPAYLNSWKTLSWIDTAPAGSSVTYRIYDSNGNPIPEAQLPGNAAGFANSPVNLSGISTTTYPSIVLEAIFARAGTSTSPALDAWNVAYLYGPQPLPNIGFTLQGGKTIGSGPSGTLYKYSQTLSSGAGASINVPNLEWDTYAITLSGSSYDIASSCDSPQPQALAPNTAQATNLYLTAHTTNSLDVNVRAASGGAALSNATVRLRKTGYDITQTTDWCGQVYFGNLTTGAYTATVSATGYQTYTGSANVSGTSKLSVSLN